MPAVLHGVPKRARPSSTMPAVTWRGGWATTSGLDTSRRPCPRASRARPPTVNKAAKSEQLQVLDHVPVAGRGACAACCRLLRGFRPEFVEASGGHFGGTTFQPTKHLDNKMRRDPCTRADCVSLVAAFGGKYPERSHAKKNITRGPCFAIGHRVRNVTCECVPFVLAGHEALLCIVRNLTDGHRRKSNPTTQCCRLQCKLP